MQYCNVPRFGGETSLRLRIIKRSCGVVIAKLPGLAVICEVRDGLPRHFDLWVHFYPDLIWQAAKSQLECSDAFGLVSHEGSPLTCTNMTSLIPEGARRCPLRRYYGATGIAPNSGITTGEDAFSSRPEKWGHKARARQAWKAHNSLKSKKSPTVPVCHFASARFSR